MRQNTAPKGKAHIKNKINLKILKSYAKQESHVLQKILNELRDTGTKVTDDHAIEYIKNHTKIIKEILEERGGF